MVLDESFWRETGGASSWRQQLGITLDEREAAELRRCTHSGKPFGEAEFVGGMEERFRRRWRRPGRPAKSESRIWKPGTERSGSIPVFENRASSG